jgi:hypothetical protein
MGIRVEARQKKKEKEKKFNKSIKILNYAKRCVLL